MKLGSWEIDIGFLYRRLPSDWNGFEKLRPDWNNIGIHLSYERTDEWCMLEIRLSRKDGAKTYYAHLPPYWLITTCDCDECRRERRRLGIKRKSINRPR